MRTTFRADPVYAFFNATSDPDTRTCKLCGKVLKTSKGNKTGLVAHMALHKRKGDNVDRDGQRTRIITSIVAEGNASFRFFNLQGVRKVFKLAGLGIVNENIARKCLDAEAGQVLLR